MNRAIRVGLTGGGACRRLCSAAPMRGSETSAVDSEAPSASLTTRSGETGAPGGTAVRPDGDPRHALAALGLYHEPLRELGL